VTTDGGKSWQLVTPPGLPECEISSIEPSHIERGTAYLTAWRYMWDDFRPYVYETTDLGKHWTAITSGLPDNEFAYAIRQDPNDASLLFLGTYGTVYVSLDAGAHWQALTLNLPPAEVRDIAINTRQGDVVVATHGRAFWVLDNLALLEQLTQKPAVTAKQSYVFAPQKAWLTHAYGVQTDPDSIEPNSGENPPFGATIFFHIPEHYDGKTPATLEFEDAQGKVVRSFPLHLQTKEEKQEKADEKAGKPEPDHSAKSAIEQTQEALAKLTAVEPGMNQFQWDLRYTPVVEVNGYHSPDSGGGMDYSTHGPLVLPGTYSAVLNYGGQRTRQTFAVALDPRLHATEDDLAARLALAQQIQVDMNSLNQHVNRALAAREKLQEAVSRHRLSEGRVAGAVQTLNGAIDGVVQMKIRSSEGDSLQQSKLHAFLSYLVAEVELVYARPSEAQYAVFRELDQQVKTGEQALEAAIGNADHMTK
jgi:hypothetical protein